MQCLTNDSLIFEYWELNWYLEFMLCLVLCFFLELHVFRMQLFCTCIPLDKFLMSSHVDFGHYCF